MDRRNYRSIDAICNALLRLLEDRPLDKILMTEIAREADVNRSTLYSYYSNPQEVFQAVARNSIQELNRKLGDSKFPMAEFIRVYLQHMKDNRRLFLEIHRSSISNVYIKAITDIMNEHLLGRRLEDDSLMDRYCNYGFFGVTADWLMAGCKEEIGEIVTELLPVMNLFEANP